MLEGGKSTELDTARATAQLNATLSMVPALEAEVQKDIFRLAVLLGQQPGALADLLSAPKPMPVLPPFANAGDPSTLLRRRPDIQSAERRLAAAVANVGVNVADLYPRITFVGNVGMSATSPRDFGKGRAETWGFGPNISWAAFDLGRVHARIKAADAEADQALYQFQQTVLAALEETEGALVSFGASKRTWGYLQTSSNASKRAAELANIRYKDGVTDFITVLDAERTALDSEDKLVQSGINAATALVAVYKALGGGWETVAQANDKVDLSTPTAPPIDAPPAETISAPKT
jgi:multidrug efflux system outer membrane protein